MKNNDDFQLISMIRDGDEAAMEEIILKYKSMVEAIAMKYIYSPLEKDDLVQEGMIGLLAAINSYTYNKGTQFKTYANICVNNAVQNAIKKVSRLKDIPQENTVSLDDDYLEYCAALSAEDEYLAQESVSNLSEALYEKLSKFENEVIKLHMTGCSYTEIARKLDKNPKAIDNAIQRIRKKLNGIVI